MQSLISTNSIVQSRLPFNVSFLYLKGFFYVFYAPFLALVSQVLSKSSLKAGFDIRKADKPGIHIHVQIEGIRSLSWLESGLPIDTIELLLYPPISINCDI